MSFCVSLLSVVLLSRGLNLFMFPVPNLAYSVLLCSTLLSRFTQSLIQGWRGGGQLGLKVIVPWVLYTVKGGGGGRGCSESRRVRGWRYDPCCYPDCSGGVIRVRGWFGTRQGATTRFFFRRVFNGILLLLEQGVYIYIFFFKEGENTIERPCLNLEN